MDSDFSLKLIFLTIILLSTVGDSVNSNEINNILTIELDIFSGRENPSWNLTSNESEFFIEKILYLPEGNMNESIDAGLGYLLFYALNGSKNVNTDITVEDVDVDVPVDTVSESLPNE